MENMEHEVKSRECQLNSAELEKWYKDPDNPSLWKVTERRTQKINFGLSKTRQFEQSPVKESEQSAARRNKQSPPDQSLGRIPGQSSGRELENSSSLEPWLCNTTSQSANRSEEDMDCRDVIVKTALISVVSAILLMSVGALLFLFSQIWSHVLLILNYIKDGITQYLSNAYGCFVNETTTTIISLRDWIISLKDWMAGQF